MSGEDHGEPDELLAPLLARYDEALTDDALPGGPDTGANELDAQLAAEWRDAKECLDFVDRVRRRWWPDDISGETLAWQRDALSTPPDLAPVTLGRFRIQHKLGHGGLGVVYLAYDPKLSRQVALKVPRAEALASDEMRSRFLREAEAAARLSHPHLVCVHDTGEEGAICYIAAEYCAGPTLSAWLKERRSPVPIELAARIAMQLAEAVQHAHGRGVLHRDIKPSNVLLAPLGGTANRNGDGESAAVLDTTSRGSKSRDAASEARFVPKLTDFGMAKLLEHDAEETRSGAIIGTPAYMAPEQAEGRVRDLDARTDVYGLGVVLYEILTDRRPHEGQSGADVLRRILFDEPIAPRRMRAEIPRDLEAICLKCMSKRSDGRYATAQQLADDLGRFLNRQPTEARPLRAVGRVVRWARRRPAMAALVTVCVMSLATFATGSVVYSARLTKEAAEKDEALKKLLASERSMQEHVYAADMQLAQQAMLHNDVARANEFLERHVPAKGDEDEREFAWHFLWNALHREQARLPRHPGDVYSMAFAPDGQRLVTGCRDGFMRIWKLPERKLITKLNDHEGEVNFVAFSRDGALLASGDDYGRVLIRDAENLEIKRILIHGNSDALQTVFGIVFSPDGNRIYTGVNKTLSAWDVNEGILCWQVELADQQLRCLALSKDGRWLASTGTGESGTARIWDAESPSVEEWRIAGSYYAACFLPDGQRLALARQGIPEIYDLATRSRLDKLNAVPQGQIAAVDVSHDGLALAVGGIHSTIQIYDAEGEVVALLRAHTDRIWDVKFAPDGDTYASSGADGEILFWETPRDARFRREDGALVRIQQENDLLAVAYSLDGELLACGGSHKLAVLKRGTGHVGTLPVTGEIAGLEFMKDGRLIAVAEDGTQQMWNPQSAELLVNKQGSADSVYSIALSPRQDRLAVSLVSTNSNSVRLFRWPDGRELPVIPLKNPGHVVRFTRDGAQFAVGQEGRLTFYDTYSHQPTIEIGEAGEVFHDVDFLPDGQRMIVAEGRHGLAVRSLQSGEVLFHLSGHVGSVVAVAASPNGRNVASACDGNTTCVWDLKTRQPVLTFDEASPVRSGRLYFSPTGDELTLVQKVRSRYELATWSAVPSESKESREKGAGEKKTVRTILVPPHLAQ